MKSVSKISTLVLWVTMIITVVLSGLFYYRYQQQEVARPESLLLWLYVLLALCVVSVLGFTTAHSIRKWRARPGSAYLFLFWLILLLLVAVVSYLLSRHNSEASDGWSLVADMSLYSIYILFGITLLSVLLGIVWSYLKKTR